MYEPPSRDKAPHPVWRFLAIAVFAGLFALGVAMVLRSPGRDRPTSDQAKQPASLEEQDGIARAESVEEGLTFSDQQQEVISTVQDHTGELVQPALYLMLRHTASLPELSAEKMADLASPGYGNLLEYPSRYRARPVRRRIYPKVVRKLTPDKGLGRSRYWPGDRPVWRIDGLNATGESAINEPVVVLSVVDPTALLGEPTSVSEDGRMVYDPNFTVEVAGVFYKVWTTESRGDEHIESKKTDYPVLLAWQLKHVSGGASKLAGDTLQALIMFLAVALMLILFFYMRRKSRDQTPARYHYRPRRKTQSPNGPETEEVDPELRAAAEATRDHRTEDDADRES
ncbi:MAG: hypothetical protein ACLFVW_01860 [Phycisphaerae bacterium]